MNPQGESDIAVKESNDVKYYQELVDADRKRLKNAYGGEAEMIQQNLTFNLKKLNQAKKYLKANPQPPAAPAPPIKPEETEITQPITSTTDFSDYTQFKSFISKLPKKYAIDASYKFGSPQAEVSFGARVDLPPNCKAFKIDIASDNDEDEEITDMTTVLIMVIPDTKQMMSVEFSDEFDSISLAKMQASKSFRTDTYTDDSDLLHKIKNRFAEGYKNALNESLSEESNNFLIDQSSKEESGRATINKVIVVNKGKSYVVGTHTIFNGRDRDTFTMKWDIEELKKVLPDFKSNYETRSINSGTRESDWYEPLTPLEADIKRIGGKIDYKY